jgi:hypothetical protein
MMTESNNSPPPIITDLVPGHNQIVEFEFDRLSGSSSVDFNKVFAEKLHGEALANRRAIWVEGKDGEDALFDYTNLHLFYSRDEDHKAMIVHDDRENTCLVFKCMQIASAIASPANVIILADLQLGSFANGFVPSSCLQEHQGTKSVLPSQPRKNLYCTAFLQNLDMKKSLKCFKQTTYSQAQLTILVRVT